MAVGQQGAEPVRGARRGRRRGPGRHGLRRRVGLAQRASPPVGEVAGQPGVAERRVVGAGGRRLDGQLSGEGAERSDRCRDPGEGLPRRRQGRAAGGRRGDVGDVDAVAEDTERRGRRGGQRARPAGIQQRQLIVVPGDDLFVVPAHLDAEVAGRGQAAVADGGVGVVRLGAMNKLGEAVGVLLGHREGAVGGRGGSRRRRTGGRRTPAGPWRRAAGSGRRGPGWIPARRRRRRPRDRRNRG